MTYYDLYWALEKLTPSQLECDVTICDMDGEFFPAVLHITQENDILDKGHPYLVEIVE